MIGWEIFYGIAAALLLAGLIYGMVQYKSRNRRNDAVTEEATRELYEHPESYDARVKSLDRKIRPS